MITSKKIFNLILLAFIIPFIFFIVRSLNGLDFYYFAIFLENNFTEYFITTIFVVMVCTIIGGTISYVLAYYLTFYKFKYKKVIELLVLLPLAVPVYIGAYAYGTIFSPTSILAPLNIDIMSIFGLCFIYIIFLYPYIYLGLRIYFSKMSSTYLDVNNTLGRSRIYFIYKVLIPLSIPAFVVGTTFFIFEIISDYGASSYYNVKTLSTAIHKSWFVINDMTSALIIALVIVLLVLLLNTAKNKFTSSKRYTTNYGGSNLVLLKLSKRSKLIFLPVLIFCISMGFIIPTFAFFYWTLLSIGNMVYTDYFNALFHTLVVSFSATALIVIIAIFIAHVMRLNKKMMRYNFVYLLGYALPSIMISLVVYQFFFNSNSNILYIISQSAIMIILAYIIRFLSVGVTNFNSGFDKIGNDYTYASYTLGKSEKSTFFKVDVPMLKEPIYYVTALVFLEVSKELSLVLFLRPFNYQTLATKAYTYANDERIIESSIYCLSIIIICTIAIFVLFYLKERKNVRN